MTDQPATPLATLEMACQVGRDAGLEYVYCGNVPGQADESTRCPTCQTVLIERTGYTVRKNVISDGQCPRCARPIPGIWR
jgi:pyruvate formate lyase activating enzyme